MADSDSSSESDSESDEEFLTKNDKGTTHDREALVRKKLLESFYGKSAAKDVSEGDDDSSGDDNDNKDSSLRNAAKSKKVSAGRDDLDSIEFDAKFHAEKQIRNSSVHELLETEERLALEVRTLDSTMQTMVYENYSRFIDATDAIRSIGVNVEANERGLRRLSESMETIDTRSKGIEDSLGLLRDQVAEKLRIKRLLTRLDALLKLPQTLREQIKSGKYRTATKSYLSASSILSKHSTGFESLKMIETECNAILSELDDYLTRKLIIWSGRFYPLDSKAGDSDEEGIDNFAEDTLGTTGPDLPKSIAEVFECAGALFNLRVEGEHKIVKSASADTALTIVDLQQMTVSASMRHLDRILDDHMVQVQENRFSNSAFDMNTSDVHNSISNISTKPSTVLQQDHSNLLPHTFLDAVLEGATLYRMCFVVDELCNNTSHLVEFVSEAMSSYFTHVRSILYESAQTGFSDINSDDNADGEFGRNGFAGISAALSILLQDIRGLASGLGLPQVGLNDEFTSKLVNEAMLLCDSMVFMRVDQKFHDLRVNIVRHCLLPFVDHAVKEREIAIKEDKPIFLYISQVASNTLSDCLQLVDDAIRSIFSDGLTDGSEDMPDLKVAVQAVTFRFAWWLANAFEILAGGDTEDAHFMVQAARPVRNDEEQDSNRLDNSSTNDYQTSFAFKDPNLFEMLDLAKARFIADDDTLGSVMPEFILGISELCRIARDSVPESFEQSVIENAGGNKKKTRGLFPNDGNPTNSEKRDNCKITARFRLAFSRVLTLYASDAGFRMGYALCRDIQAVAGRLGEDMPLAPREAALEVLKRAKIISIECSVMFGGSKRANPIPEYDDTPYPLAVGAGGFRKTGVQLDVERMFKESIIVYPHPTEIVDSSRNSVLFLFFKVCFSELLENVRHCCFSLGGVAQLIVDIEFLKHMLSHYINSDFTEKRINACSALSSFLDDAIDVIEGRLCDGSFIEISDLRRESREIISGFLNNSIEKHALDEFTIDDS